ncbi:unnamed protein product [Schistosoma turkestanicum]|nr:unnamed protein product [Schistosoma turkestanicum]
MDWLGKLSSIKGQLTNVTKDLLAEGTYEINDTESELSLARKRICELESVVETQKTEINSLRCRNEELLVQLESSQLRLDHAKELCTQQLREKDILISKLQAEVSNERGEPEGQQEASLFVSVSLTDNSTKSGHRQYPDLASEDHQVPSSVSHSDGTVTWEELKNEVIQLRAELTKWKKVAKKKEKSSDNTSSYQLLNIDLEKQIDQLKRQYNDLQETHRNEIAAVQESHSDHLSNLVEQLKETEAEVIKLQKQVDDYQSCSACVVKPSQTDIENNASGHALKADKSISTEIVDLTLVVPSQENDNKARSSKKKKKKSNVQINKAEKPKSISCEMPYQTDHKHMKNSSVVSADQIETKDGFIENKPYQSSCSTSVQTESLVQSLNKELQTDSPYEKPTTPVLTDSVGIQFSSTNLENSYDLGEFDDASCNNYQLICSTETKQTQFSSHEDFNKSNEINELADQLIKEINAYNRAIFNMLNLNGIESSQTMSILSQSNHETNENAFEKLKILKSNIQSHRKCITKNVVHKSVNMNLSVPVSHVHLSGESNDFTEVEPDGWQDDDFPELNSNAPEQTKYQSELSADTVPVCNEELQDELSSSPHTLKEKIQQLEEMLSNNSITNANRIAELESQLQSFNRLQKSLNTTVSNLLSLPPPPTLPSHLLGRQSSCTWPPTSVEDQLDLLTASEVSARNEIIRLNDSISLLDEKCKRLECDNQKLCDQLTKFEENFTFSNRTRNLQISEDFVELSSLAYQLCISLDPEISEKEWNPDDWETELFTLLKDRLDSEVTEVDEQSEDVVKLSAEVAALRDILAQHVAFKTQAEQDLKQLLFTIQNQHDMINKLTIAKQQLESVLSDTESKSTPITTTAATVTDLTTADAFTSTEPTFTTTTTTAVSTGTSTTTDDVANDDTDHKCKASCMDIETQTSLIIDNATDEENKSEENYEHYCKELIKSIYSIHNDHLVDSSQNSQTLITSPELFELTNISKVFSLLEKFSVKFNEYKINSENFQSMYSTVVNSLQQKHMESQSYHEKLQHCLTELNEMKKRREEAEISANSLRQQLSVQQDRLDSEVTEVDEQSEDVVKLSAEVAALRDILAQHVAFKTQAEQDLKQLLFTIQNQHDMINKLTIAKQQLESVLSDTESKSTPITTTAATVTDLTTADAFTSTEPTFTTTTTTAVSTGTSTTTDDVANDDTDHKCKASCMDIETQTSLIIDNATDEENKSEENYEHYCKELIKSIYSIHNDHLVDSSQNSQTLITSPELFELTNISKVFSLLEKFSVKFNEYKINSENFQSMYSTVVNSLQQKHMESQSYHEKLQHCLTELNEMKKRREEAEISANSLRQQLSVQQMEAENIVKHSVSMNEYVGKSTESESQSNAIHFEPKTSNEEKLIAEIQRLQAHLVEMEESYTSEAVIAENREVELRSRLTEAENSLANLKNSCTTTDTQIQTAYSERDNALKHLEASRREVLDLKESLKTLQTVLDNFQRNQEATLLAETERLRSELNRTIQKEIATKQEMEQLNQSLINYQELTNELHQMKGLNQQLHDQILRLETKVKSRDTEIDGLRDRLAKMAADTDARIDKVLIKNLLLSYLQLHGNQRDNAIRVIGSLLGFSDEDYLKIGNESGALPKLVKWVRNTVSNLPMGPPQDVLLSSDHNNKTFTELLLAFLEEESSPRSPIKLPMDYYTPNMTSSTNKIRKQVNATATENKNYSVSEIHTGSTSLSNPPKFDNDLKLSDHKPVFYML